MTARRHRQLLAMLKVGTIGFGGGSALIPVMERELVNDRGGLTVADFTRGTVIANITPGALPAKLAALSGVRLGGPALSLLSAFAVALPGTALTVGLLAFFASLGPAGIRVVEAMSLGVTAFILFLLAHYAAKVLLPGGRVHRGGVAIAVAVFLLTGLDALSQLATGLLQMDRVALPKLSALGVIVAAIVAVGIATLVQRLSNRVSGASPDGDTGASVGRRAFAAAGVFALVAVVAIGGVGLISPDAAGFLGLIAASTVSSFGGGEAYVAVADGFLVAPGIVDDLVFYGQLVPVANALPGPILVKIASGAGYGVGTAAGGPLLGVVVAAGAFLVSVATCAAIAVAVLGGYDRVRTSRFVRNISVVILPVVCGLLATTAVSMLHASAVIGKQVALPPTLVVAGSVLLAVVITVLHARVRVPDLVVIAACAALSFGIVLLAGGLA